jgi:methionyl-tRNA synthetase
LRIAAVLLLPVMPAAAAEILRRVGSSKAVTEHRLDDAAWAAAGGLSIVKGDALWPRLVDAPASEPSARP